MAGECPGPLNEKMTRGHLVVDEREEIAFEAVLTNLKTTIKWLWGDRIIDGKMCWDLVVRAGQAKNTEELRGLAAELARIVEARKEK